MEDIKNSIGERIRKLRKENNMTQQELANKLYVKREVVNYYENNSRQPKIADIICMSKIFNVSTDYILLNESARKLDNQEIYQKFGLDDNSIMSLAQQRTRNDIRSRLCLSFLNYFISNGWLWEFSNYLWRTVADMKIDNMARNSYKIISDFMIEDQKLGKAYFISHSLKLFSEIVPDLLRMFYDNREFNELVEMRINEIIIPPPDIVKKFYEECTNKE